MGLNCVAGTTEYDEDEGIGLVLYVNSESNLIVWKMSDGTKQGTAVPLTTDYQSMLKSEFENKTGITIDYIIIHPYTGDTINVESSITINSGDTPVQPLNIALRIGGGSVFAPAAIIGDILHVYISAEGGNDTSNRWVVNADGRILANNGAPLTQAEYTDLTKGSLEAEGYETSSCVWEYKEFVLNETISDWNSYVKI